MGLGISKFPTATRMKSFKKFLSPGKKRPAAFWFEGGCLNGDIIFVVDSQ